MSETAFVQHVVTSIFNELALLKSHNYIQPHAYEGILKLLPTNISNRDMPSMGAYPPTSNNQGFTGGMPTPSPTQSNNSVPISTPASTVPPPAYNASPNESKLGSAEALYDYTGENPNTDLNFRRGDNIQLTELVNDDWWKGTLHGKTGIFPRTYVKRLNSTPNEKINSPPPPPPPARNAQRDSFGYSPVPPKQESSAYNYPPPPQKNAYAPPPPVNNNYAPPPPQQYGVPPSQYQSPPPQQMTYAPPPPLASSSSAPAVVEQPHEESKVSSFGKKLAGNVANAATWGFGATLGSDVAHSIF